MKQILLVPVSFFKHCFYGKKTVSQRKSEPSCLRPLLMPNDPPCRVSGNVPTPLSIPPVSPRVRLWPQPVSPFLSIQQPERLASPRTPALSASLKPEELREFLALIKPLDHGNKTELATLYEEMERLAPSDLSRELEVYHKRLLAALTPESLKKRIDYSAAIRSFIKMHPHSLLFPKIGLKDQGVNAKIYEVPRILASVQSPVLAAAFQQMREGVEGIYSSPYFADDMGSKVAGFLNTGKVYFKDITQAFDLYEIGHHLGIESLQEECRKKLIYDASSALLKPEELEPLWALATFYEDTSLQFACIQYAKNQSAQVSHTLDEKRRVLQNLSPSLLGTPYFDGQQRATATLREFDSSHLAKCREVGMESIKIMYATPQMEMAKLAAFKCLDLDYKPDSSISDHTIVASLCSLLTDNKALTELKLRLPQLSAGSAQQLVDALQKSSLRSFELRFCQMDAEAVSALTLNLSKNQKLEKVTLRGTGLGQQGLQQLAEGLKNNHQIHQLALPGCKIESSLPAFKESLKGRLPKLEIVV